MAIADVLLCVVSLDDGKTFENLEGGKKMMIITNFPQFKRLQNSSSLGLVEVNK